MTAEQKKFIESIAAAAKKYAPLYGIKVISPVIAQAINESGWGKSALAAKYHNYFGMKCGSKWTGKSVNMTTKEEYTPGTLTTIKDNFRVYDSLEDGVKGYFDFINTSRYANLKGVTDPETYLKNIKADGYATSSTYVENNMKLVKSYNLTEYDAAAGTGNAAQNGGAKTMTEAEVRKQFAAKAAGFVGTKEGSSGHHAIIDGYNAHKPLARGYKVTYTDAWCATFASYIAILMGFTDIIPTECGCNPQIELWKQKGRWVENDAYTPAAGDYIYYDWQDSGVGDNMGGADHVGIVESVSNGKITVVEGNKNNAVERRTLNVNGRYIRGYGVPNFSSKATAGTSSGGGTAQKPQEKPQQTGGGADFALGEVVMFNGNTHFTSANAENGKPCKPGKAKITQKYNGKHPLHCVATREDGGTVYGWVNASDVSKVAAASRTYTVKKGDSLWAIADKQLGDGSRYNEIKALNGLTSNTIYAGQTLKLPQK